MTALTMTADSSTPREQTGQVASIEELPHDELLRYGRSLGLELTDELTSEDLAKRVREHRGLLHELDRDGLLDVIKWSRRPVREDSTKEELVREIAGVQKTNYDSLSRRGLVTLARLRGIPVAESDGAEDLIDKLRKQEGLWKRLHRKRRSVVGSWLARLIDGDARTGEADYQFLPDDTPATEAAGSSLKREIEDHGVVSGIASRLRGAADDYIQVKLDEIEERIDAKLNEIDQRLAEWRDREVANRLRILRITLAFTVVVAVLSLGYNYVKNAVESGQSQETEQVIEKPLDSPSEQAAGRHSE